MTRSGLSRIGQGIWRFLSFVDWREAPGSALVAERQHRQRARPLRSGEPVKEHEMANGCSFRRSSSVRGWFAPGLSLTRHPAHGRLHAGSGSPGACAGGDGDGLPRPGPVAAGWRSDPRLWESTGEPARWCARSGPGALLAVRTVGAYGSVLGSNYNSRSRPAEVMVDGKQFQVVREKEDIDALMKGESTLP